MKNCTKIEFEPQNFMQLQMQRRAKRCLLAWLAGCRRG